MSAGQRLPGTPEPSHTWTGADGITIAGDCWGPEGGRLALLLHGGGQTRHAWKGAGETLAAAGYRAIAFDARGHGDSSWATDPDLYSGDRMVEDLKAVIAANGGGKPCLVGASMGAGTSLLGVGEDRIDAGALVLVDMAPKIEPDGVAKIQAFMNQKPDGFDSLEEVAEAIAAYQPHRKRPRQLDGLAKNVRLGANGKYVWHWDPARRSARSNAHGIRTYREALSDAADNLKRPFRRAQRRRRRSLPAAMPPRGICQRQRRRPHGRRRPQRYLRRLRRGIPNARGASEVKPIRSVISHGG